MQADYEASLPDAREPPEAGHSRYAPGGVHCADALTESVRYLRIDPETSIYHALP